MEMSSGFGTSLEIHITNSKLPCLEKNKNHSTKNETLKKTYGNPFKKVTLRGELLNVAG